MTYKDAILACEIQIAALEEALRALEATFPAGEYVEEATFDEWRRLQGCLAEAKFHLSNFTDALHFQGLPITDTQKKLDDEFGTEITDPTPTTTFGAPVVPVAEASEDKAEAPPT